MSEQLSSNSTFSQGAIPPDLTVAEERNAYIDHLRAQLAACEKERCEHCGAKLNLLGCGTCGAPVCCPSCCRVATLEQQLAAVTKERDQIRLVLENARGRPRMAKLEQQLAALTLRWTTDRPTKAGWYWWRYSAETKRTLIEISGDHIEKLDVFTVGTFVLFLDEIPGHWAGPIALPEEQP